LLRSNQLQTPIGYLQATVEGDVATIAYVLGTEWQGQGLASESVRTALAWILQHGIASVEAHINPDHSASEAVASAVGLVPTGVLDEEGEQVWSAPASDILVRPKPPWHPGGASASVGGPMGKQRQHAYSGSPWESSFGYSRAVRHGDHITVSGTAPIWSDGDCPPDIHLQAERCFEIALAAVAELGGGPADVVRTRMYITNPADSEAVGAAHMRAVGVASPAATMIVVVGLLDPRWKLEIELDAVVG